MLFKKVNVIKIGHLHFESQRVRMAIQISDIYFIQFIAFSSNPKQSKKLIELISKKQCLDIKRICQNILNGKIQFSGKDVKELQKYKNFIRAAGYNKITNKILLQNLKGLKVLLKLIAKNGTYKESSSGRLGRMEFNNEETGHESESHQSSESEPDIKSFYNYYYESPTSSSDEGGREGGRGAERGEEGEEEQSRAERSQERNEIQTNAN